MRYINKFAISIINIGNQLLNLLAKAFRNFILLKLPFCQNNEIKSKHFLKKFHHFTKK